MSAACFDKWFSIWNENQTQSSLRVKIIEKRKQYSSSVSALPNIYKDIQILQKALLPSLDNQYSDPIFLIDDDCQYVQTGVSKRKKEAYGIFQKGLVQSLLQKYKIDWS